MKQPWVGEVRSRMFNQCCISDPFLAIWFILAVGSSVSDVELGYRLLIWGIQLK